MSHSGARAKLAVGEAELEAFSRAGREKADPHRERTSVVRWPFMPRSAAGKAAAFLRVTASEYLRLFPTAAALPCAKPVSGPGCAPSEAEAEAGGAGIPRWIRDLRAGRAAETAEFTSANKCLL